MLNAVNMDDEGGIRPMPPAKPMLAGGESIMRLPEVNNLAHMDPDPKFSQNLEKHQWPEAIEGDSVVGVLGLWAKPSPL